MYIGGGAVTYEQSFLLGGLVILCKSWRWAAWVYAAARILALACSNSLGPFHKELVIREDDEADNGFLHLCDSTWSALCFSAGYVFNDLDKLSRNKIARSVQCCCVGHQLQTWKDGRADDVNDFLRGRGGRSRQE